MTTTTLNDAPSVPSPAAGEPLYRIDRFDKGFRITRPGYIDASIRLEGFVLTVEYHDVSEDIQKALSIKETQFGAYQYRSLRDKLTSHIYFHWQELPQIQKKENKFSLNKWACKKLGDALNFQLYPEWKNLLSQMDEERASFMKLACAKLGPKFTVTEEFFARAKENRFFWEDLHKYNATWLTATRVINNRLYFSDNRLRDARTEGYGFDPDQTSTINPNEWRKCFAQKGETYKALNKTLDHWPRGISWKYAQYLNLIKIQEPVTDRVKLNVILNLASYKERHNEGQVDRALAVVQRSSPEQIRRAHKKFKKYYEKYIQRAKCPHISLRSARTISFFTGYLVDYPEEHNGEICGLLEKSIAWHRDLINRREAQQRIYNAQREAERAEEAKLLAEGKICLPPTPLPEIEGIVFLDTVQKIMDEGTLMQHCVGKYAMEAIKGHCYLFHCDYDGDMATIHLDKNGRIVQSRGPRNCTNKASAYAEKELTKWVSKTREAWLVSSIAGFYGVEGNL